MERAQFLKSVFALAVLAAIEDLRIPKLLQGSIPATDAPGWPGQAFKIRLHKDWFRHGDIVWFGSRGNAHWLYTDKNNKPTLTKVSGKAKEEIIEVELYDNETECTRMEERAHRICSAYIMEVDETGILPLDPPADPLTVLPHTEYFAIDATQLRIPKEV